MNIVGSEFDKTSIMGKKKSASGLPLLQETDHPGRDKAVHESSLLQTALWTLTTLTFKRGQAFEHFHKFIFYWWLVRVASVVAFGPNILGDGGDLWMMVLLKSEWSFSDGDNHRWWEHSTLLAVKNEFLLIQVVGTQKIQVLALAPRH